MKSDTIMKFYHSIVIFVLTAYNAEAFCYHVNSYGNQRNSCNRRSIAMKLEYRNAKISDIGSISELCSESFDGPFQWHQQIQRLQSIDSFKVQLTDRLNNLVSKGVKHCMIVAVDGEKPEKSSIVGFLEVGLLPSPIGLNEPAIIRDDTEPSEVSSEAATSADEGAADVSEFPASTDVSSNISGKEEATTFLASDTASATSTENAITNETANSSKGSVVIENQIPIDIPSEFVDPNELVLAAAAIEAAQNRKKKREEVPYLGNVAVSQDCR